jgi:hypothetical protein
LLECHDHPTASHFGIFKTLSRVRENYYWPKMIKEVTKYIKSCRICGEQKPSFTGKLGLMGREKNVRFPWQVIATDFMGPFPKSRLGNKYLVAISDWFTKYVVLLPLKKASTSQMVRFLENQVLLVFVSQFILCDNGTQFAGRALRDLAAKYRVQSIWFNARYHPQVNFVERTHRSVGTAIKSYVQSHDTWDGEIQKIQQAINTARHEITGYTPAFLNFGRHVPLSGNYYGTVDPIVEDVEISPGEKLLRGGTHKPPSHI